MSSTDLCPLSPWEASKPTCNCNLAGLLTVILPTDLVLLNVRMADTFIAHEAQLKCNNDVTAWTAMDVDDLSDYAGSEMGDKEEYLT